MLPWSYNGENVVLDTLFDIESLSNLLIIRTGIKSQKYEILSCCNIHFRVSCCNIHFRVFALECKKPVFLTLLNLQVSRIGIKSQTGLNFFGIVQFVLELLALEC